MWWWSEREASWRGNAGFRKDVPMSTSRIAVSTGSAESDVISRLRHQYGCGPIEFAGTDNAFYERHLVFDNIVDPAAARLRERFEAIARSVRDVLSQRWIAT